MVKAQVIVPKLHVSLDVDGVLHRVANGMRDHYQARYQAGLDADGNARPLNLKGMPMGSGSGSLDDGWRVVIKRASRGKGARAEVGPRNDGRWGIVTGVLKSNKKGKGVKFVSLDGDSQVKFDELMAMEMAKVQAALDKQK